MNTANKEIEVRFLEIDEAALIERLHDLHATDLGEDRLEEIIFYDQAGKWQYEEKKFVRIRKTKRGTFLTYKHTVEVALQEAARALGLDWSNAVFELPRYIIEKRYNIPVSRLKVFTFTKIE